MSISDLRRNTHSVAQSGEPNVDNLDTKPKKALSKVASAEIDARKAESRLPVLHELAALVRYRDGSITDTQLYIVASIMSYLIPWTHAEALPVRLAGWCTSNGIHQSAIQKFLDSPACGEALSDAIAAAVGERRGLADSAGNRQNVDPRKDYSIKRILAEFAVTEAEEAALDLKKLISEKRRSALRRDAEGIQPKTRNEPWIEQGLSETTYRRRRAKAAENERVALLATITETQDPAVGEDGIIKPIEDSFYNVMVAKSAARKKAVPRTSEGRKAAKLIADLSLTLDAIDPPACSIPPGRTLTAKEEADLDAAIVAAQHAEARQNAREIAEERRVWDALTPAERAARLEAQQKARRAEEAARGDRPARVSEAVWHAVPPVMCREQITELAAHFFISGHHPDIAVGKAVSYVRWDEEVEAAVLKAALEIDPAADLKRVAAAMLTRPGRHVHDVAREALADVAAEADVIVEPAAAVAEKELTKKVRAHSYREWRKTEIDDAERDAIVIAATQYLLKRPHVHIDPALHIARDAYARAALATPEDRQDLRPVALAEHVRDEESPALFGDAGLDYVEIDDYGE